jgi:ABC-type spermidine/putrescine transport system permease subunit II
MYQYLEYRADPTIAAMSTILVGIGILAAIILGRLGSLGQLAGAGRKPR